MQHPDDVNTVGQWFEKHDVPTKHKAANACRQLVSVASHQGLRGPQRQLFVQPVYPSIRVNKAVLSDVAQISRMSTSACGLRVTRAMLRSSWLGSAAGACFRFGGCRVPRLTGAVVQTPLNFASQFVKFYLPKVILLADQAKALAHDFAGRGVQARAHLCAYEFLKLRCEIDVQASGFHLSFGRFELYQKLSKIDINGRCLDTSAQALERQPGG